MLAMHLAMSALAGAFLTPAQVVTDVQVACNYAAGDVLVLVPVRARPARQLLEGTCARVMYEGRYNPDLALYHHARGERCVLFIRPSREHWWTMGLGSLSEGLYVEGPWNWERRSFVPEPRGYGGRGGAGPASSTTSRGGSTPSLPGRSTTTSSGPGRATTAGRTSTSTSTTTKSGPTQPKKTARKKK